MKTSKQIVRYHQNCLPAIDYNRMIEYLLRLNGKYPLYRNLAIYNYDLLNESYGVVIEIPIPKVKNIIVFKN